MKISPTRLLLVDDSDDDARLFVRAVERCDSAIKVERAACAAEARYLLSRSLPALIVLDRHLPDTGGIELLQEIRMKTALGRVPIVMMSGTEADGDVEAAYAYGINSFVRKPNSYEEYVGCVRRLVEYWCGINCTMIDNGLLTCAGLQWMYGGERPSASVFVKS